MRCASGTEPPPIMVQTILHTQMSRELYIKRKPRIPRSPFPIK